MSKRADSQGLFWSETDTQTTRKIDLLHKNEWAEILPGYWAESKYILDENIDHYQYCFKFADAYDQVRTSGGPKRTPPEPVWLNDDYLPHFEEALRFDVPLFTDQELAEASFEHFASGEKHPLIFDIECYQNYFQCAFRSVKTGKIVNIEMWEEHPLDVAKLQYIVDNFCIIGFNSANYDLTILALALAGKPCEMLKSATNLIIESQIQGYKVLKEFKVKKLKCDHIDIMPVAPQSGSLKIYGGRNGTRRMQDLPFPPEKVLSIDQITCVRYYCVNDLVVTDELMDSLNKELKLRLEMSIEYQMDLRSKSDAQIAEAVIKHELESLVAGRIQKPTIPEGTTYHYRDPGFLQFQTPMMQEVYNIVLNTSFRVNEKGSIELPQAIKDIKIQMGEGKYNLQIGGLHSKEKNTAHYADKYYTLEDRDVTSYYPFIILNQGLFPSHLGPEFLTVYRAIVNRRLRAKEAGDKKVAGSLKIVINGSFGKLGSKYSIFYAPDLLIQVTLTGQLALLMLIEAMEISGISVVSANTDGIVVKCHNSKQQLKEDIFEWWQKVTAFNLEATPYKALFSRDVNNYIAVGTDPKEKPKVKGAFGISDLSKNPTTEICTEAVIAYITTGTPLATTIYQCTNIAKFVTVRAVKGGAVKVYKASKPNHTQEEKIALVKAAGYREYYGEDNWILPNQEGMGAVSFESAYARVSEPLEIKERTEYLGKAIRWYYAKGETGEIVYANSGNKVPKSDGAIPLMDMGKEKPQDLDHEWYIQEAENILKQIAA